jgi:hypothetical protein
LDGDLALAISAPENLAFVASSFEEDVNRQYAAPVPPVSIWFALAALTLSPPSGSAQSQTEQPQFDAASVKVNESADRPSTRYDPVRIDLRKASIKQLIQLGPSRVGQGEPCPSSVLCRWRTQA